MYHQLSGCAEPLPRSLAGQAGLPLGMRPAAQAVGRAGSAGAPLWWGVWPGNQRPLVWELGDGVHSGLASRSFSLSLVSWDPWPDSNWKEISRKSLPQVRWRCERGQEPHLWPLIVKRFYSFQSHQPSLQHSLQYHYWIIQFPVPQLVCSLIISRRIGWTPTNDMWHGYLEITVRHLV